MFQEWKDADGSAGPLSTQPAADSTPAKESNPMALMAVATTKPSEVRAGGSKGLTLKRGSSSLHLEVEPSDKKTKDDTPDKQKESQKAFTKAVTAANKVKQQYQTSLSSYYSFLQQIDSSKSWAWAKSAEVRGPVDASKKALDEEATDFLINFMCLDMPQLKKYYPDLGELTKQITNVPFSFGKLVSGFSREVSRVHSMHLARQEFA